MQTIGGLKVSDDGTKVVIEVDIIGGEVTTIALTEETALRLAMQLAGRVFRLRNILAHSVAIIALAEDQEPIS